MIIVMENVFFTDLRYVKKPMTRLIESLKRTDSKEPILWRIGFHAGPAGQHPKTNALFPHYFIH